MRNYDIILIHPPAHPDFRQKSLFPGPLGTVEQVQFTKVPIGMLSLAEYLDRHGYKVIIDNLGDRMMTTPFFDLEQHIKELSSRIFAIGLHFQQHSPGAMEIARLCKKRHPGSPVVLGGLTATRFHDEIIRKYEFVDAVIRGESEKAFVELMQAVEKTGRLSPTPNLTYRTDTGEIVISPLKVSGQNLDDFEYTRFDLLEPVTSIFTSGEQPRWSLAVCRGCIHNCAICGGSAYSYKTYLGLEKPLFRSPNKIVADMKGLAEQGIKFIGLYQDPRMGGREYCRELIAALRRERPGIERLSMDLLVPADEDFIREIASIGKNIAVHICPDTGCETIRGRLGRHYSNEALLKTIKLCHKHLIPVTSFFSVGLAGETAENITETWDLWDKISALENIALTWNRFLDVGGSLAHGGPILGPIVLDPGSLAFDFPEKYGYKLLYKNIEECIRGLSLSSWHQWINYETEHFDKHALTGVILQSVAFTIEQREQYGFFTAAEAAIQRAKLKADILAINEVDRTMS